MRKFALFCLILCVSVVSIAAVSSFYIVDDTTGDKIPFGTGGELHFQNISGLPNAVTVFGGDASAHTSDTLIHFTQSEIDHTAIQNIGTNSHAALDTFVTDTTADIASLDSHAADSTIHFTEGSIDHTAIQNIGTNSHAALDTFVTDTAADIASLDSHAADSTIHFTASSLTHDALSGAAGYSNHSTIDAHIDNTALHSGGTASIPTGTLWMFAGSTAPTGWMIANGDCISRSTYSALFAVIGETYDACDSSTTFGLPDFRGRTAIGAGQGSGLSNRTLGETPGEEAHSLSADENGQHTHTIYGDVNAPVGSSRRTVRITSGDSDVLTTASGSGTPHNTMQPSLVLNYIIKY